jgi:F-type H+-transporting ATPase subunit delta
MARGGSAPRRYAEAVFELAERDNALDRWRDDLRMAADVAADPDVDRLIDSPRVPLEEREAALQKALGGRLSPQAMNLVSLLARRKNLALLGPIAAEYQRLLNQRRGVVPAVITSARPLSADEDRAIRDRVASMTGATVDVTTEIDPALIGGLTVRIGDRLIDASVRGRLERLREQLLAGARTGG